MEKEIEIQIIEPPIYEELNWNMELIMKALEYLRQNLSKYLTEIPNSALYFLKEFEDKLGNPYPLIAVGCEDPKESDKIPNFHVLFDRVNEIVVKEITIEKLKREIMDINSITWEELQKEKYYPKQKIKTVWNKV